MILISMNYTIVRPKVPMIVNKGVSLMKNEEYICPRCGSAESAECTDWDWGDDYIVRKMFCFECNTTWREYYHIKYDGYTCEDKEYDADGKEVGW